MDDGQFMTQLEPAHPNAYVSVIGTSFLFPITCLIEALDSISPSEPNEVQTSSLENGYAVGIIVLTVLLLESTIHRTQYVMGRLTAENASAFIRNNFADSGCADKIEELYVLRDVIAHNHIWEAEFIWDDTIGMKLISADLQEGYGDRKFKKVIDTETRKTRILGINLFPTRIYRADALIVMRTVVEFLLYLERKNRNFIDLSSQPVKYHGEMIYFKDLVTDLWS